MVDIMTTMQGYFGMIIQLRRELHQVVTILHQLGAQQHMMDGDSPKELLEPQTKDWHCLVHVLGVSTIT